jgi:4-methyl-5(b-hydroxyethyl)-thiazole monophosphate biosynthesis
MKIAVVIGTGFEDIEALAAVDIWRRAGYQVDVLSINGRRFTEEFPFVVSRAGLNVQADAHFEEKVYDVYDAIYLPGGQIDDVMNSAGYKNELQIRTLTGMMKDVGAPPAQKKYLIAICAAPNFLHKWGVLDYIQERRRQYNSDPQQVQATVYPGLQNDWPSGIYLDQNVVVNGNLITGDGPGATVDLAFALVNEVGGAEAVEELKRSMRFR